MDFFIARQPIFDREQDCVAYEILARSGPENFFISGDQAEQDEASRKVIAGSSLIFGFDELTFGRQAFINATRDVLVRGDLEHLPPDRVVVELIEDVPPDPEVIDALTALRGKGYEIALDDFVYSKDLDPLVQLADIIKVDFRDAPAKQRKLLPSILARPGLRFLAEKVETAEEMQEAQDNGYDLFQGYFFSTPTLLKTREVPGSKLHYLRIMKEISKAEFDLDAVVSIVSQDPSLSYNLLRQVNSIAYGFKQEIETVRKAVVLLGEVEVRKIIALLVMFHMGDDRPAQLLCDAMTRARFCESVAIRTSFASRSADLFLLGMFSLLDTMVGRPMAEILGNLPLAADLKAALLGRAGPLRRILDLAVAYERGTWESLETIRSEVGIDESELPPLYVAAISWTQENFMGGLASDKAAA